MFQIYRACLLNPLALKAPSVSQTPSPPLSHVHTHGHNHVQITAFILPKDALSPQHVLPLSDTSHSVHFLNKLHMIL